MTFVYDARAFRTYIFRVEPSPPVWTSRRIMMSKRIYATLVLCLACVSALVACAGADNSNVTNTSNANANANRAAATPAAATPAATVAAGDKIGVAECDDYL